MGDDWDPWKRYWREQERRMWDPFYRYEYERDRMAWDPYFRVEKEIERRYGDPEFRWRKYEEKRNSGEWLEAYYENPLDPVLRQRYESTYGRRDNVEKSISNFAPSTLPSSFSSTGSSSSPSSASDVRTTQSEIAYAPYYRSVDLPSLKIVVAEALAIPLLSLASAISVFMGNSTGSPLGLFILALFAAFIVGFFSVRSAIAILLTSFPLTFFVHVYNPFAKNWRDIVVEDWRNATIASFVIAGLYILAWYLKIRSEE